MTPRVIFISLWLSLSVCGLYGEAVFADQEFFPFLAEVTGDQVNVRAGQSTNFERVCQLQKGEEVIVLEKEYSWYKIQLPPSAESFVNKAYVQFLGRNAGGIIADRVNIRAGAGIHSTVLGRLTKGEQIYIAEELDEWYRIHPVEKSCGWVADRFVAFKSGDITKYQALVPSWPSMDEKKKEPIVEKQPEEEARKKTITEDDTGIFPVIGYVKEYADDKNNDIHYKMVVNGQPVCYIQGRNHMLGRFLHYRVSVEGTVNQELQSTYVYPVISISKVRLIF